MGNSLGGFVSGIVNNVTGNNKQEDPVTIPMAPGEKALRDKWKEESEVEVFSKSNNSWYKGVITKIVADIITVKYVVEKPMARYDPLIIPASNSSNDCAKQKKKKKKNITLSPSEKIIRDKWKKGSKVEIFSNSNQKWFKGIITEIKSDMVTVALNVSGETFVKTVPRYDKVIAPYQTDKPVKDKELRDKWTKGSLVWVWSVSNDDWCIGAITEIKEDNIVHVEYVAPVDNETYETYEKDIDRYDSVISSLSRKRNNPNTSSDDGPKIKRQRT